MTLSLLQMILKKLADQFKAEYKEKIGKDFPDDPKEQLNGSY